MRACRGAVLAVAAAVLNLAITAPAAAAPPADDPLFDRLFGGEREAVDPATGKQARRDDLTIVGVRLGRYPLIDAQPAFQTPAGLCLPVTPILKALELEVGEPAPGHIEAQLFNPARRIVIDSSAGTATVGGAHVDLAKLITPSSEGACLALDGWAKLLPLRARYDSVDLRVVFETTTPLPIEERLERAARRDDALRRPKWVEPNYPAVANPWRLIAPPSLDLGVKVTMVGGAPQTMLNLASAGDLLGMTARLRTADRLGSAVATPRLTLGREADQQFAIAPLHARSFALGDVTLPAQPLITDSTGGRGIVLSSRHTVAPELYDRIEITGPLPNGWEAELYQDDQLLAFIPKPDAQGDYRFANVALKVGLNRFTVRRYGPHGERDERTVTRLVGGELKPENEWSYTVGVVQPGQGVFGALADGATPAGSGASKGNVAQLPIAAATVEHGLARGVSARVDVRANVDGTDATGAASLYVSESAGFGALTVASNGTAAPGVAASLRWRPKGLLNIAFDLANYGTLVDPFAAAQPRSLRRTAALDVSTRVDLRGLPVTVHASAWHDELRSGGSRDAIGLRASATSFGVAWSNAVDIAVAEADGVRSWQGQGTLSGARDSGRWRLRGDLGYRLDGGFALSNVALSVSRRIKRAQLAASATSDIMRGTFALSLGGGAPVGPVNATGSASISSSGGWRLELGVDAALLYDAIAHRPRLAPAGVTSGGLLRPLVFVDTNGDGMLSPGERTIPNARFIVNRSVQPRATGADGSVLIDKLPAGQPLAVEVQQSSLDDPDLRTAGGGRIATLRAGQVLIVPVPLVPTGEIEATVIAVSGDVRTPISGAVVQAIDAGGRVVASAVTEYDGYAYFDGVPFGRYRLRLAGRADRADADNGVTLDANKRVGKSVLLVAAPKAPE